ncbi:hypothetical protein AB0H88_41840 [Nonomuraea sp. NPDC050680]|uniref:hypothetical protein n=1 Tax=Nonomuraea sp. NPDC050680 TaxID=3154630 RepID=UPI0033E4C120
MPDVLLVKAFNNILAHHIPQIAAPDVPVERILQAPAAPLPADKLRAALRASRRVKVAVRTF